MPHRTGGASTSEGVWMAIVNKRAGMAAAVIAGSSAVFFSLRGKPDAPQAAKADRPVHVVVTIVRKTDEAICRSGLDTVQTKTTPAQVVRPERVC